MFAVALTLATAPFDSLALAQGRPVESQSPALTVTLTGQSMIRSDIRATASATVSTISALLKGADVVFTNFEGAVGSSRLPKPSVRSKPLASI